MSTYTKRLYELVNNSHKFVRCFYGICPECKKRVFSIDEKVMKDKIKARFICSCGKKWQETVYSSTMNKYKYPQALVEDYRDKKRGLVKVLKRGKRIWLVTPTKVLSKELKQ